MQYQRQFPSRHNSYIRPGMQHQSPQRPQHNPNVHPDVPTFYPQQGRTANNPFNNRDDREAMIFTEYEESKCLDMFNENVVENLPNQFNDVPEDMLINIQVEQQHDNDRHPFPAETRVSINPDLVDIDFSLPADKTPNVLCKENNSSGLPKINCDTLKTNVNPVSEISTYS